MCKPPTPWTAQTCRDPPCGSGRIERRFSDCCQPDEVERGDDFQEKPTIHVGPAQNEMSQSATQAGPCVVERLHPEGLQA